MLKLLSTLSILGLSASVAGSTIVDPTPIPPVAKEAVEPMVMGNPPERPYNPDELVTMPRTIVRYYDLNHPDFQQMLEWHPRFTAQELVEVRFDRDSRGRCMLGSGYGSRYYSTELARPVDSKVCTFRIAYGYTGYPRKKFDPMNSLRFR